MMASRSSASVADKFNLTDAEADWVDRQVSERGVDVADAAMSIRAQRVGSAALPDYRPLPANVAEEVGVAEPFESVTSDNIDVLDAESEEEA